jgi:hypothetical protein
MGETVKQVYRAHIVGAALSPDLDKRLTAIRDVEVQ